MASNKDLVEFICDQINECGSVIYKKMFGEYMVYSNGKPIFCICNDILFVKISEVSTEVLGEDAEQGYPYSGAKAHYIVTEIEDKELLAKLALEVEKITPLPKIKKKKANGELQ